MSARRVLLLRHARTGYNAEGRFQGQSDVPLDEVGLGQAKRAADALAGDLDGERVRIVSSDLSRARATADALGGRLGLAVEDDPRLREVHGGVWQGHLQREIVDAWPREWAAWRDGDALVRRPGGGESRLEAGRRALAAIDEHATATDGGTLVCVLHGACAKAATFLMVLGEPPWPWHALDGLRNAHWAEFYRPERAPSPPVAGSDPGGGSEPATRSAGPGEGWRLARWNLGVT